MRKSINICLAIISLPTIILFTSCKSQHEVDPTIAAESVKKVSAGIVRSWNEGDFEAFIKHFDEEAILMPPNTNEIIGLAEISKLYRNSFENNNFILSESIEEVHVFGDFAYQRGSWEGSIKAKEGSFETKFDNKVLTIYRKGRESTWKIYRWMYSANGIPKQ